MHDLLQILLNRSTQQRDPDFGKRLPRIPSKGTQKIKYKVSKIYYELQSSLFISSGNPYSDILEQEFINSIQGVAKIYDSNILFKFNFLNHTVRFLYLTSDVKVQFLTCSQIQVSFNSINCECKFTLNSHEKNYFQLIH